MIGGENMKKQATALVLIFTLLTCCTTTLATEYEQPRAEEEITRRYEDIKEITPSFTVSGRTATFKLTVIGNPDVTKISAVLQIQKENSNGTYSNYGDSWTASAASNFLNTSGAKSVTSGGTYRLKVTVTPYIGGTKGTPETAYST